MAGVWAKKVCGKPTKSSPGFHTQVLLLRALSQVGNPFTSLGSLPVHNKDAEYKRKLDPHGAKQSIPWGQGGREQESSSNVTFLSL